jgi:hypothetical protein
MLPHRGPVRPKANETGTANEAGTGAVPTSSITVTGTRGVEESERARNLLLFQPNPPPHSSVRQIAQAKGVSVCRVPSHPTPPSPSRAQSALAVACVVAISPPPNCATRRNTAPHLQPQFGRTNPHAIMAVPAPHVSCLHVSRPPPPIRKTANYQTNPPNRRNPSPHNALRQKRESANRKITRACPPSFPQPSSLRRFVASLPHPKFPNQPNPTGPSGNLGHPAPIAPRPSDPSATPSGTPRPSCPTTASVPPPAPAGQARSSTPLPSKSRAPSASSRRNRPP